MTVKQLIEKIGSVKMLRVERWRDDFKRWRAGIEWFSEDRYEFVCEYPTLKEALECCLEHLDGKSDGEIAKRHPYKSSSKKNQ